MRSRRNAKIRLYAIRGISLTLLVVVTFFLVRGAVRMYGRYNEASVARAGVEAQVRELREREAELVVSTKHLTTDRGIEEELRHRFGVAREGERVIDIVPATNTAPVVEEKRGVIEWIKRLF